MAAPVPLATPLDVADVWRALTEEEEDRASNLISKASALLRQACPWVDARVATWRADPTNPAGLDPELVATVVATVVKRFLANKFGVVSEGMGGYSVSYAARADKGIRGELEVLPGDVERLSVASRAQTQLGTIRVKSALAATIDDTLPALDIFVPGDPNGTWFDQGV